MATTNWKKQFSIIYAGQAFSILGSFAVQFSIVWWLTTTYGSGSVLTISMLVAFLPGIFLGPFAGVVIDRYNRKTVMIAADALVAFATALLGVAFWALGTPPMWMVYAALFMRGLGSTFHSPAMQAAILLVAGGPGRPATAGGEWLPWSLEAFPPAALPPSDIRYAYVGMSPGPASGSGLAKRLDIVLAAADGRIACELRNLTVKRRTAARRA